MDNIRPIEVEPEMGPPPEEKEQLIVETEGASKYEIVQEQQESVAPVFGAERKPSSLNIMSISEEPASPAEPPQQPPQQAEAPKAPPAPQLEDEEEDPPLFPEPIDPNRNSNNN
jgi:hypothetical protein